MFIDGIFFMRHPVHSCKTYVNHADNGFCFFSKLPYLNCDFLPFYVNNPKWTPIGVKSYDEEKFSMKFLQW